MPVACRNATIAHENGDLVQCFGQRRPEVPVVLCTAQIAAGVTFDRVVEVGEFERVAQKKYRRVVADKVPIAFLSREVWLRILQIRPGFGSFRLTRLRNGGRTEMKLPVLCGNDGNL